MKRLGNLFEQICAWDNLELAAKKARRGKRYRLYAENFELRRETILRHIRAELLAGTWQPRPYRTFTIHDPKERLICAPCYRDRIVHHALCNVIAPLLERTLVHHSYSCRVGKGTGAARDACQRWVRRYHYVLKLDVSKYFPSIDHALLKEKIRRLFKCQPTLDVVDRIIDSWQEATPQWLRGDELLTPTQRPRGVPIGSLTSQLFANLFLSRIDHLIQEQLRPSGYARYTDDLLLFSDSKADLRAARERLMRELEAERLRPHPTKCRIHQCREGVPFLGFRYWPDRVRVLRENRFRFERRMHRIKRGIQRSRTPVATVWPAMFGWFQFVRNYPVNEGLVQAECARHRF
jgi:retron-type reverse transcriptase